MVQPGRSRAGHALLLPPGQERLEPGVCQRHWSDHALPEAGVSCPSELPVLLLHGATGGGQVPAGHGAPGPSIAPLSATTAPAPRPPHPEPGLRAPSPRLSCPRHEMSPPLGVRAASRLCPHRGMYPSPLWGAGQCCPTSPVCRHLPVPTPGHVL